MTASSEEDQCDTALKLFSLIYECFQYSLSMTVGQLQVKFSSSLLSALHSSLQLPGHTKQKLKPLASSELSLHGDLYVCKLMNNLNIVENISLVHCEGRNILILLLCKTNS